MKKLIFTIISAIAVLACGAQYLTPDRKIATVEKIIETFYADPVDTTMIVEEGIKAMLKALDPHSSYTNAEETKELNEPLQGNFSGIGIQFQMINDTLYVLQTIAGGPSEKVGITPGDRILAAGDSVISGVKRRNPSVMKLLRGPKGSTVDVKVQRPGTPSPITFRIVRDDIPIYSVDAAYMATPTTGYIRVSRFAEETPDEVAAALEKLTRQGMTELILDLQDNGGGYLYSAYRLAEMFLDPGSLIVFTDSRNSEPNHYYAEKSKVKFNGPVVVLVNEYSASASEILSGAIQDHDRGVIVGRRTFGKGLVQRPFPFPDGSMVRLTVSRYHTPSGRCIQKPFTPGDVDAYTHDLKDRYDSGELYSADSIKFDPSLRYTTLRNRRTVYGGGGIMPDSFVPVDTTHWSTYYRDLLAKGIYNRFAVNYVDTHRAELKKAYPTEDDFIARFNVTPEMMERIVQMGEEEGVDRNEEGLATSGNFIATVIKGIIGRDLFEQSTYFRVANQMQPVFLRAVEILADPAAYNALLQPSSNSPE